jgi:hypothetical protein
MFSNLTEDNYIMYAMKVYDRPVYIINEFEEDIKRFSYLNRLFHRYVNYGEMKERLIINHLVILNNVFSPNVTVRLLFLKIHLKYHSILKTFLLYLNIMKDTIPGINGRDILSSSLQVDYDVVSILRELNG